MESKVHDQNSLTQWGRVTHMSAIKLGQLLATVITMD